jgi:HD-like signal output (HDOD) protein
MHQLAIYFHGADEFESQIELLEVIGLDRARNLALTHYMLHYEFKPPHDFSWTPFWEHSVSTGLIVELIYQVLGLKPTGTEFATGLFHDLGKLILSELHAFTYLGVLRKALKVDLPLAAVEHEIFGLHHAELGGWWLRENSLPKSMCEAIELHESTDHFRTSSLLPHALIAANYLAQFSGCGFSGNSILKSDSWHELLSVELLWSRRRNKDYSWEEFAEEFPEQIRMLPILNLSPDREDTPLGG